MEVDSNSTQSACDEKLNSIVDFLVLNNSVTFKSQQRDENELSINEKRDITKDLFNKSKFNFLARFGEYLQIEDLNYFKQFVDTSEAGIELNLLISTLTKNRSKDKKYKAVRNRRYNALEKLIEDKTYFSELEMMKRNPLLYYQLVGQYLSEAERRERDKAKSTDTFVKILMESIDRDHAREIQERQEENENNCMEEEEDSDDDDENESQVNKSQPTTSSASSTSSKTATKHWGEFTDMKVTAINKENFNNVSGGKFITEKEREMLRSEFLAVMHESFLNGSDENFDYNSVDNNEEYDDLETYGHDEEDKYFDSETPEDVEIAENGKANESSEDELDIYMNALKHHPTVIALSEDMKKL